MTGEKFKTIYMQDLQKYPGWSIREKYIESAMIPYCANTNLLVKECNCKKEHRVKNKVGKVDKAIIYLRT